MRTRILVVSLLAAFMASRAATADYLVSGFGSNNVLRYDDAGNLLGVLASPGEGGLVGPIGLALGPGGSMLVNSSNTDEVLRFDPDGNFIDAFIPAGSGRDELPHLHDHGPGR